MASPHALLRHFVPALVVFTCFIFLGYQASHLETRHASLSEGFSSQQRSSVSRPQVDHTEDVFNETLGFQKILALNLPSRPDRRDSLSLAASLTGLRLDYVDGVTEIEEKAVAPHDPKVQLPQAYLASLRAHMNAIRFIVEHNISSALIIEDDADWDIRIKPQMRDFARAAQLLVQPKEQRNSAGATRRHTEDAAVPDSEQPVAVKAPVDLDLDLAEYISQPSSTSPYGDISHWDVLWLGHCGTDLMGRGEWQAHMPHERVFWNDQTVPEAQHLDIGFIDGGKELKERYPKHTRIAHHTTEAACVAAYALSLPGAQRLLYEMSSDLTEVIDLMLGEACAGINGREQHVCLTVQPQLFNQHRPAGDTSHQSDISNHGGGSRKTAFTHNIRWSARVNFRRLLHGRTDFVDSFPDGTERQDLA